MLSPNRRRAKLKRGFIILIFVIFLRVYLLHDGVRRHLKCTTNTNYKIKSYNDYNTLNRNLISHVLRYLQAEEDPCVTEFPINVPEYDTLSAYTDDATDDAPEFPVAADDDDTETPPDDSEEIVPEEESATEDLPLDEAERTLQESFEPSPEGYDPEDAEDRATPPDEQTIAYVTVLEGCPEIYAPPEQMIEDPMADLYEAGAVIKSEVCEVTETAQTYRRLGATRKLESLSVSAAELNYTMITMIHPMGVVCPVPGSYGATYDRAKLLQSEGYKVEVLGHPITEPELLDTNPYIAYNIQDGIGIRDSMKLNAWTFEGYPAVVMVGFDNMITQPLDQEIDALLADANQKGLYVRQSPTEGNGIDTQFMIIKPSMEEFRNIVSTYINTPYDPITGWNGQGHHGFKGEMGLNGFLSYYFANNPGYTELDRCTYANSADESCLTQVPVDDAKVVKIVSNDDVGGCGNPRHCPYNNPNWSETKQEECETIHRKCKAYSLDFCNNIRYNVCLTLYFYLHYYSDMMFRYISEKKYLNKQKKSQRTGFFKTKSFIGYCHKAGKSGYESMVGIVKVKPDWQTVCPPIVCPSGQYLKPDCTCTSVDEDPCAACPHGTFCQRSPTLMCMDCNCGFCDIGGSACCTL